MSGLPYLQALAGGKCCAPRRTINKHAKEPELCIPVLQFPSRDYDSLSCLYFKPLAYQCWPFAIQHMLFFFLPEKQNQLRVNNKKYFHQLAHSSSLSDTDSLVIHTWKVVSIHICKFS